MRKWSLILPVALVTASVVNGGEVLEVIKDGNTPATHHEKHQKHHKKKHHQQKQNNKMVRGDLQKVLQLVDKKLKLTTGQKKKIHEISKEFRAYLAKRKKEFTHMSTKNKPVKAYASSFMSENKFYPEAFKELIHEKWKIQDRRRDEWREIYLEALTDTVGKIFQVLTPQQRKEWIEITTKMHGQSL